MLYKPIFDIFESGRFTQGFLYVDDVATLYEPSAPVTKKFDINKIDTKVDTTEDRLKGEREKATIFNISQSKEEGKDQESIHSSTTPDPGHRMRK